MKITSLLLFITLIGSIWLFPSGTFALGIIFLLFSLATAIQVIFKKHKQAENPPFDRLRVNFKIAKDVLILVITLLLILFLGGLAGMYANQYASSRFGIVVGFISAIVASFVVGYLVKTGVTKIFM